VFKWYTGKTCICRLEDCRLQCTDPNKMYEFKWDILVLGEEASASIENTLWRVSTTFTRSAITPPEVNGFGWNLGNSEHVAWSWPWHMLGAIRAEARAGDLGKLGKFCFLSGKQRTTLPISGQPIFTKFAYRTCFWEMVNPFGNIFFENLPLRGFFSKKTISDFRPRFLGNDYKPSYMMARRWNVGFPSVPLESTQSHSPGQQAPYEKGLFHFSGRRRLGGSSV